MIKMSCVCYHKVESRSLNGPLRVYILFYLDDPLELLDADGSVVVDVENPEDLSQVLLRTSIRHNVQHDHELPMKNAITTMMNTSSSSHVALLWASNVTRR